LEIYITTKNVYGNDLFYVKNKFAATVVKRLTGRKTVSRQNIDDLSLLGVKVRVSEEAQDALGWTAEEAGTKAEQVTPYTSATEADIEAWKQGRLAHFAKESEKATEARREGYRQLATEHLQRLAAEANFATVAEWKAARGLNVDEVDMDSFGDKIRS
jgi:hypothetical protein